MFVLALWLATCDALMKLRVPDTTITSAQVVQAGAFQLPPGGPHASAEFFTAFDRLPAFCRLQATVKPAIEIEVWLPVSQWNGKYLAAGNGGYGGSFNYFRLGEALNGGYVAASTDTGHKGAANDSQWAAGHPQQQIDFDYRATHEMAIVAKAAMHAFYGRSPEHSYFNGCSNGGRQGLIEAELYPADYDGILAGAPAVHWGFKTFPHPALDAFRKRGGKLIIYHGSKDEPELTIDYYKHLRNADRFAQLYVVPGMHHCGGGDVPNDIGQYLRPAADPQHSLYKALERWVERGIPPEGVIATQYKRDGDVTSGVLRTTTLSPY